MDNRRTVQDTEPSLFCVLVIVPLGVLMRFATIQTDFGPRAAVLEGDNYIDLYATDPELPPTIRQLLEEGPAAFKVVQQALKREKLMEYESSRVKLLPPVPDPPKIVCLGLNYADHAKEGGV